MNCPFPHLKFILGLFILDPGLALCLWVDKQWKSCCFSHDYAILDGQIIIREALQVPLTDSWCVDQHLSQVQVSAKGNVPCPHLSLPLTQ